MHEDAENAVLVIHNTCNNSVYKANNGGDTFRGVMIVDSIDKLHSTIIGALVGVGAVTNDLLGNGTGSVLYCRDLVTELIDTYVPSDTQLDLTTTAWQEIAIP